MQDLDTYDIRQGRETFFHRLESRTGIYLVNSDGTIRLFACQHSSTEWIWRVYRGNATVMSGLANTHVQALMDAAYAVCAIEHRSKS